MDGRGPVPHGSTRATGRGPRLGVAKSADAGLPEINVAPNQGKLLYLFALASGPERPRDRNAGRVQRDLARPGAAAGRKLVTLEADPRHAAVARPTSPAPVCQTCGDHCRAGRETLLSSRRRTGAVRPVFIDADKASTAEYFAWSLELSHRRDTDRRRQRGAWRTGRRPGNDDQNVHGNAAFLSQRWRTSRG